MYWIKFHKIQSFTKGEYFAALKCDQKESTLV